MDNYLRSFTYVCLVNEKKPSPKSFLVALPMFMYTYETTKFTEELNFFEKAVLAFKRHPEISNNKIADYLGLEEELIDEIVKNLTSNSYFLEQSGALTDAGRKAIESDGSICIENIPNGNNADSVRELGYVFQMIDSSGRIFPRYIKDLREQPIVSEIDKTVVIGYDFNDEIKRKYIYVHPQIFNKDLETPYDSEIWEAIIATRRTQLYRKDDADKLNALRITSAPGGKINAYVFTYIYLPFDPKNGYSKNWQVVNPFDPFVDQTTRAYEPKPSNGFKSYVQELNDERINARIDEMLGIDHKNKEGLDSKIGALHAVGSGLTQTPAEHELPANDSMLVQKTNIEPPTAQSKIPVSSGPLKEDASSITAKASMQSSEELNQSPNVIENNKIESDVNVQTESEPSKGISNNVPNLMKKLEERVPGLASLHESIVNHALHVAQNYFAAEKAEFNDQYEISQMFWNIYKCIETVLKVDQDERADVYDSLREKYGIGKQTSINEQSARRIAQRSAMDDVMHHYAKMLQIKKTEQFIRMSTSVNLNKLPSLPAHLFALILSCPKQDDAPVIKAFIGEYERVVELVHVRNETSHGGLDNKTYTPEIVKEYFDMLISVLTNLSR